MRKVLTVFSLAAVLIGCGGGGGGGEGEGSSATTTAVAATDCSDGGSLTVSGVVTYERVPFSSVLGNGLDYNNIQTFAVRGAEVQALGAGDCVISSGVTSSAGAYSLSVAPNTDVKIRVNARTVSTAGAIWDFEIRDNTNANGLYVLDGASAASGTSNSARNLTATTGWTGSSYGGARVAAPFAILDTVYASLQQVVAVDATANMDAADIFWSVNNSTASGTLSLGEIGGTFYSNDQIYVLGAVNSDTDEFDSHIIIHEWGHYLEDNLSRSDSLGGSHAVTSKLDPRVALSEGFGNAFSGMVSGDPVYRDSSGALQASDFQINVETNASTDTGWFSEGSVQTILYDIFDSAADANDGVNLGFAPIYNAMTSTAYSEQSSFTTIFSLVDQLKTDNAGVSAAIDTIVTSQSIDTVVDFYGTNETNNGGDANDLPVYKILADDGVPVVACSTKTNGEFNRLGNRQFLRLNVVSAGVHNIVATRISGAAASTDPDVRVYLNGVLTLSGISSVNNTETVSGSLNIDEYMVEVYNFDNVDNTSGSGGSVCYSVTVS
jgi:hypothetical protein